MGPLGRNGEAGRRERRPLELNPPAPAPGAAPGSVVGTSAVVHDAAALLGVVVGSAPLLIRLAQQGWVPRGVVVVGATLAVVVPTLAVVGVLRRPSTVVGAAVASAAAGAALLPAALAVAATAFVVGGLLATTSSSWSARGAAALGLLIGSAVLLFTPRAVVPAAVVALAVAVALVAERAPRPRVEQVLANADDSVRRSVDRVVGSTREAGGVRVLRRAAAALTPTRRLVLLCLAVSAAGVAIAIRDQRVVLIDDAAITFRYAERIASGDGFTFNDGDRTNGASAPLYTLLLAVARLLGRDVEATARVFGVACHAAAAGLVTAIAGRARGLLAGAVAGVVLLATVGFRTEALTGMESGFAAVLGLVVVLLLVEGRTTWAGIVLGLAVVNKLDAAFLAVGVGLAWWLVHRRPPWRLAGIAAATAAPWFLFSQLYFGSVLPHSASQKLGGEVVNERIPHDPTWMLGHLFANRMTVLLVVAVVASVALVTRVVRTDATTILVLAGCGGWAVLHGAAFSLLDLGDPYPWYATVLYPPVVVAGVTACAALARDAGRAAQRVRSLHPERVRLLSAGLVLLLLLPALPGIRVTAKTTLRGRETTDFELFEQARRDAGRYVGRRAAAGEVVRTCYGWIAYGAIDQPIDEVCPLSTREDVGPPRWFVVSYLDGDTRAVLPPDAELVREFRSPLGVTEVHRRTGP